MLIRSSTKLKVPEFLASPKTENFKLIILTFTVGDLILTQLSAIIRQKATYCSEVLFSLKEKLFVPSCQLNNV